MDAPWKPTHLRGLYTGSGSVAKHLLANLPSPTSKALIVTGDSLSSKTNVVRDIEHLLGAHHAKTFSSISEHAPSTSIDTAFALILADPSIDTIVSIGGGSPIDASKVLSYRLHHDGSTPRSYLYHIAIPTTLSAAECTPGAGYTDAATNRKVGVLHTNLVPSVVIYDSSFPRLTPVWLLLSTGLRALDHAVELLLHPDASEMPCRWLAARAAVDLFELLPRYHAATSAAAAIPGGGNEKKSKEVETVVAELQRAAFASLGFFGLAMKGSLGLSHSLGHALGASCGIPHGVTSCITLGAVVRFRARREGEGTVERLASLARNLRLECEEKGDLESAIEVGTAIDRLVAQLGLKTSLTERGVSMNQIDGIVERATKETSGTYYEEVRDLVKTLY